MHWHLILSWPNLSGFCLFWKRINNVINTLFNSSVPLDRNSHSFRFVNSDSVVKTDIAMLFDTDLFNSSKELSKIYWAGLADSKCDSCNDFEMLLKLILPDTYRDCDAGMETAHLWTSTQNVPNNGRILWTNHLPCNQFYLYAFVKVGISTIYLV